MWCDVLLWLQKDPDTNAKDLLAKLREALSGPFGDAHLRTLQRRVKDGVASWPRGWSTPHLMNLHRNGARRWN